jgi:hypothetical protein
MLAGLVGIMILSDLVFSDPVHRPRPKFFTGFGWFAVVAIMAVAVGIVSVIAA